MSFSRFATIQGSQCPSQISKSSNGAGFEVHFSCKVQRIGLLICYSISHKEIIQLTCALMQRCTPIFILLGVDVNQVVLVCNKVQELELNFPGLMVRRLGPHSAMLNPIENVWSKMKSHKVAHESTSCSLPRSRRAVAAVCRNTN